MFGPKAIALSTLALIAGTASAQFADAVNYSTPTRPSGIIAADLNGDHIVDLAVTTDFPDRVTILLGNGDGTFAAPIRHSIPNGQGLGALAAGDFDGNGTVDLAVVMKNTNRVAIMNNNGSGFFLLGSLLETGALPVDVQAGDLDGNGTLDLVSANRDGNNISVMMNSGSGVFTVQNVAAGAEPRSIALGDLNGDGSLDAVVALHDSRSIIRMFNTGGSFGPSLSSSTAGERPEGIAIADVNNDGFKDVLFTIGDDTVASNYIGFAAGNGAGSLAAVRLFHTNGLNSSRIVAADFNNDGFADVAVTNEDGATVSVVTGSATGLSSPLLLTAGTHPDGIVAADLNGDGRPDIACSNRDSDNTSVFLSNFGRGCAGDFNRDGVIDFNDYLDFIDLFSIQAIAADVNHDQVIDGMDYLDFLAGFAAGC